LDSQSIICTNNNHNNNNRTHINIKSTKTNIVPPINDFDVRDNELQDEVQKSDDIQLSSLGGSYTSEPKKKEPTSGGNSNHFVNILSSFSFLFVYLFFF
jgi:hypothetical protein